ncbi:MAG: threonine synthase [Firmicutes bacterium]|nr:threonine synthase [Bacillota bacterium]
MFYESTRGNFRRVFSAEAIKLGISPDGGLFVPREIATFDLPALEKLAGLDYRERAFTILKPYLTDFSEEEVRECVALAYNADKYDTPEIAPLRRLAGGLFALELWHGPTSAFKDMALTILPHLMTRSAAKTGEKSTIVILVATSGDTGKAALEGFKDVPGTRIVVFYPEEGVSRVQKRQMITQEGKNVAVVAVRGNFDDAQNGVKEIFGDAEFNRELNSSGYTLSSANSINWGRLLPQIAYYFSAYADLLNEGTVSVGDKINFVVPTGNFGNILAAFYAREMGLPVRRLICAANANNVLADFIRTGAYDRRRPFIKTASPSMDILISSNLERLLYHLSGRDHVRVRNWMADLKESGRYSVDELTRARVGKLFWSDFAGDGETKETIRSIYRNYNYLVDTHTAVGLNVYKKYTVQTGDPTITIVVSTASPFKFNESVAGAILGEEAVRGKDEFSLLEVLAAESKMEIPQGLKNLDKKPVWHASLVAREEMQEAVRRNLLSV